jgi:large subunit ribosomal protein L25
METVTLEARNRTATGKGPSRRMRNEGFIPVVSYSRGTETLALAVSRDQLRAILRSEHGQNSLIDLKVDGGKSYAVMIKEYTVHPISRQLLHADFLQVDRELPVEVMIPFRTVGKSKGEQAGGTLLQHLRHLKVRCAPGNIPIVLEADVSALEIDDVLRVNELTLPPGIEVLHREDQKLVVVKPPRVEDVVKVEGVVEGEVPAEGEAAAAAEGGEAAEGAADAKGKDEGKGKEGKGKGGKDKD